MPTEAATCARCGGALRTIGGIAATGGTPSAAADNEDVLTMQLAGLQHAVQSSRRRMVVIGALAGLLALLLILLIVGLHFRHVFEYATISQVEVEAVAGLPGIARIRFQRDGAGKVEFVRTAGAQSETLVDHGAATGAHDFEWGTDGQTEYSIIVRYRQGWCLSETRWSPPGK